MFLRQRGRSESRRTLLFIHGLGESGLCFESIGLTRELEPYRLLVPDLPGDGRTVWPERSSSLEESADHLARWIEQLEIGRVVLVGHSMGGVIAQLLASRLPELVEALVNIDGNLSPADCVFSGRAAEYTLEDLISRGFDEIREDIYDQGEGDPALRGYYVSLRLTDPRVFHEHSLGLLELSRTEGLARDLAMMEIPSLYIAGSPGGACERSLRLLDEAGASWCSVSPSGHWPFIDRPRDFIERLVAFLKELPARGKE